MIARLRPKISHVPGATLYFQAVQDLQIGGRMANAQYQYTLSGENLDELYEWAPQLLQKLRSIPQLKDVNSDQQVHGLEANVVIDRDTAARLGITPQQIDAVLYDAFGQEQISTIYQTLNQYHVVMEVDPKYQMTPDALKSVYVITNTGAQVPLSAFAHFAPANTALAVNHQGQFPAVTLSFNLAPGGDLGTATRIISQTEVEMRMPASIHGSFQGTAAAFQDSLSSEPILILAALVAVYIVLGILYESYIHPITILSTLPSAGTGALLALLLFHMQLDVIGLIGIILLIGIVKKNAIMMIDFALEVERTGKSAEEVDLRSRPGSFPSHHDDYRSRHAGRAAAGAGTGRGFGNPAPAGYRHRRRADRQPDVDALHHARGLSVHGLLQGLGGGAPALGRQDHQEGRSAGLRRLTRLLKNFPWAILKVRSFSYAVITPLFLSSRTRGPRRAPLLRL